MMNKKTVAELERENAALKIELAAVKKELAELKNSRTKSEFSNKSKKHFPITDAEKGKLLLCYMNGTDGERIIDNGFEMFSELLETVQDVNSIVFEKYENLVMASAELGLVEETKLLINAGIDVSSQSIHRETAGLKAARNGHFAVVEVLAQNGYDLNNVYHSIGPDGKEPCKLIDFAIDKNDTKSISMMLKNGYKPTVGDLEKISIANKRATEIKNKAMYNKYTYTQAK